MPITINHPLNSKELEILRNLQNTTDDLETHISDEANPHNTTFLLLGDTPSDYIGQSGKVPIVNTGETGLEFSSSPSINIDGGVSDSVYTPSLYLDGGDSN